MSAILFPQARKKSEPRPCSQHLLSAVNKILIAVAAGFAVAIAMWVARTIRPEIELIVNSLGWEAVGGALVAGISYSALAAISSCWAAECRSFAMFNKALTAPLALIVVASQFPGAFSAGALLFHSQEALANEPNKKKIEQVAVAIPEVRSIEIPERLSFLDGFKITLGIPYDPDRFTVVVGKYDTLRDAWGAWKDVTPNFLSSEAATLQRGIRTWNDMQPGGKREVWLGTGGAEARPIIWTVSRSNGIDYYLTLGEFTSYTKAKALKTEYVSFSTKTGASLDPEWGGVVVDKTSLIVGKKVETVSELPNPP